MKVGIMKDGIDESDTPYDSVTTSGGEVIGLPPVFRFPGDGLDNAASEPEEDIVGSCSFNQTLRTFLE